MVSRWMIDVLKGTVPEDFRLLVFFHVHVRSPRLNVSGPWLGLDADKIRNQQGTSQEREIGTKT
jgi:hypothetical protein